MIFQLVSIIYSPYLAFLPMLYLVIYYGQKRKLEIKNSWDMGLLLLFFWALIVGLLNDNISMVTSFVILGYFFVSIYLQEIYNEEIKAEKLYHDLFVLSLGSAFLGFLEYVGIISYTPSVWKFFLGIRSIDDIPESFRIAGTFNNPNLAGTWYAIMALIGLYFFISKRKMVYLLGILIYVSVLLMTGSRGAFIGLFIGLVLYAYYSGHKKKMFFLMFSLLSGVTLMLFFPEWFPRGDILFSSISDRQAIWENTFHMFLLKPITGWGIMGIYFADHTVYQYLRVFHAHNIFLTIATTLGTIGLIIVLWMQWNLFQEIRLLYRYQSKIVPLLSGIQGMIFGQGLFDFTIMSPQIGLLYIGSSAVISGLAFQYVKKEKRLLLLSPSYIFKRI